jgi:transcriptional regulator with GAF, ATPase, and Fis domain
VPDRDRPTREPIHLEGVFVLLADTLAADFDLNDVLDQLSHACVDLLHATAAGILLSDGGSTLRVVAASDESSHLLEVFQLQAQSGPCLEAFATGTSVAVPDLAAAIDRWPEFVPRAAALGFRSVHAFPMRLRSEIIGAVNLFHEHPTELAPADAQIAQALADISTISVIQLRRLREREHVAEQLQLALNSRIVIEQAKGVLSEVGQVDMGPAFDALRRYARDRNLRLSSVAADVVSRELDAATVLTNGAPRS